MDQTKPDEIQKPDVTEIAAHSFTATEPMKILYENLNKRMLEWLIG